MEEKDSEQYHYEVNVTNDSSADLEDVEMHYRAFIKRTVKQGFGGGDTAVVQYGGITDVPLLPRGKGTLISTGTIEFANREGSTTVTTRTYDLNGFYTGSYSETKKNRDRADLMGLWVKVYHDGKLVGEYKDLHDDIQKDDPRWSERPTIFTRVSMGE